MLRASLPALASLDSAFVHRQESSFWQALHTTTRRDQWLLEAITSTTDSVATSQGPREFCTILSSSAAVEHQSSFLVPASSVFICMGGWVVYLVCFSPPHLSKAAHEASRGSRSWPPRSHSPGLRAPPAQYRVLLLLPASANGRDYKHPITMRFAQFHSKPQARGPSRGSRSWPLRSHSLGLAVPPKC